MLLCLNMLPLQAQMGDPLGEDSWQADQHFLVLKAKLWGFDPFFTPMGFLLLHTHLPIALVGALVRTASHSNSITIQIAASQ